MVKKGFKIVHADGNHLTSCITQGSSCVEYKLNEFVKSNEGCGSLCVFNNRRNAQLFYFKEIQLKNGYDMFECEFEPTNKKPHRLIFDPLEGTSRTFPKGTLFASKVKLTKRVEGWKF